MAWTEELYFRKILERYKSKFSDISDSKIRWAFSTVSSRAIPRMVPEGSHSELAMIPMADFANCPESPGSANVKIFTHHDIRSGICSLLVTTKSIEPFEEILLNYSNRKDESLLNFGIFRESLEYDNFSVQVRF